MNKPLDLPIAAAVHQLDLRFERVDFGDQALESFDLAALSGPEELVEYTHEDGESTRWRPRLPSGEQPAWGPARLSRPRR